MILIKDPRDLKCDIYDAALKAIHISTSVEN